MSLSTSSRTLALRAAAEEVASSVLAPHAQEVDERGEWPERNLRAIGEAGLLALHVPRRLGGHEQGLLGLALVTEAFGRACPSTALCFGMHAVGSAVIAAKGAPDQEERFLRPIVEGRHVTSLALSETGTGAHFYLPQTEIEREGDDFVVRGQKQFITSGGHADSYVLSTIASGGDFEAGVFNLLVLEAGTPGMRWLEEWRGFGMRGNSSRGLDLDGVRVPVANLLGEEGDQLWYVFEVVTPYFLMAISAAYLGLAQAALDVAIAHLRERRYGHSGESLADVPTLQARVGALWADVERTRRLLYHAAELGDLGDAQALPSLLSVKAEVAELVVRVTDDAMALCGGSAYRENGTLARLLRDARAAHVMAPTTDMLRLWVGRTLLGLPLL